ncbi:hypothetical protein BD410DRAFT_896794 [Rickenella mellea]|uniref:Fungal-type protein kinase domain-containing protein n=1 Tax=Rickenella mellea TaxID=50990 RepID=A0A4Y7QAI5_9AGAM|nr:hypothetical protein BD410DRAFT_896794 [Rickenella mellea]
MEVHSNLKSVWFERSGPVSTPSSIFSPFTDEEWALRTLVPPTAFGRRTHIEVGTILVAEKCHVIVVKTQRKDAQHRYKENDLFLHAHKDGYLPGLVRVDRLRTNIARAAKGRLNAEARDCLKTAVLREPINTEIPEEFVEQGYEKEGVNLRHTPDTNNGVPSTLACEAGNRDNDIDVNVDDDKHYEDADDNRDADGAEEEQELVGAADEIAQERASDNNSKEVIIFRTIGKRLSSCTSILQFLMVMYDSIEAHCLLAEQGILHRDISWANILVDPEHFTDGDGVKERTHGAFIDGVLNGGNKPCANLTDLDKATSIGPTPALGDQAEPGVERTGTPMFISRHIAGEIRSRYRPFQEPIREHFELPAEVLDRYLKARNITKADYHSWNNFMPRNMDDFPDTTAQVAKNAVHSEYHDAESFYWIIVWFLLRAWPCDADGKPSSERPENDDHLTHCAVLFKHDVQCGRTRTSFASLVRSLDWDGLLPKETKHFCRMLADMTTYIHWPWWAVRMDGMRFHAHDALQRLLLKEIWRISEGQDNNPIPLYPKPLRIVMSNQQHVGHSGHTLHTLKRQADEHSQKAEVRKRLKYCLSPSLGHMEDPMAFQPFDDPSKSPPLATTSSCPVDEFVQAPQLHPIVDETFRSHTLDKYWFDELA